ncbi:unnamed protein product [Oreochromis niloticus]|nr:unnamed protein product [Mustela putorius furo]
MLHGLPPSADTPGPGQRAVTPATPAKVPKYNGLTPLEPYLSQVRLAARHNSWSDEEAATQLALVLEGDALQVLHDLAASEQHELQALTIALERRFGQRHSTDQSREQLTNRSRRPGESLGTFAADVLLYACRGYPEFPAAAREELSLHAFLRGLFPERLRQHVRLAMPQTLREALLEAERAELVLTSPPNQHVRPPNYPQIRAADYDREGEVPEDLELVHDFWLADIQEQCIIGLDLLTRWGACVDTAKLAITVGTETLALQCGQKQGTGDCRQTRLVQHTTDTGSAQPICLRPRQLPLSKWQGERAQEARGVATARATAGGRGWLSLTMQQLKQEQEADATLVQVGAWLEAARRPGWTGVSGQGPEVKAYYSQYNTLETHDGLLYRRWRATGQGRDLLQLLVPRTLRSQVLELVHGSVGASHYGNAKTLRSLRGRFYWPGCRRDVELHVHCCDTCTARKGSAQCFTVPLQQHRVGAPMERVGGDVLEPFPVPEAENRRVLVARDGYRRLRERPRVVHEYTHQAQVSAAVRQKRACDTRCRGGVFVPGDKVWVYCPVRKRGVSPELCSHWQGPAEVVERLTEVVYRIRMPGPGRVAVLHQDRLSPYCPPAPAAARAGDAGGTPGSHPSDSSPAGRDLPARRRKTHGHLQDFVLGQLWSSHPIHPVPRVRGTRAQLIPAPVPRPAEALLVPAPVPVPQVGTAAAQPSPVPVPVPVPRIICGSESSRLDVTMGHSLLYMMGFFLLSTVICGNAEDKPRPVLTVSPSWLSPGASVTLNCQVEHPSAGWSFYWYKAVPDLSEKSYSYELLPDGNGTAQDSYIIHGQTHTAGYVCRAGRGDPEYHTDHSQPKFVWSADVHSAASLTVSPDRVQHFTSDSVSLTCEGNFNLWRVMTVPQSDPSCYHKCKRMFGPTCNIYTSKSDTGVYWCESRSGEFSSAVNITVQNNFSILLSPVHPVTEGASVSLSCSLRTHKILSNVFFYHNDKLIQNDTRGELNISAVSKSDEGFYKCQYSGRESAQSWMSVKVTGRSSSPVWLMVGLVCGVSLIIILLLLLYRCRQSKYSCFTRSIQSESHSPGSSTNHGVNQDETHEYGSLQHGADEHDDITSSVIEFKDLKTKNTDSAPSKQSL